MTGVILLNGELHKDIKILDKYQHMTEEILLSIQSKNIEILKNNFNWERFSNQIIKLLTKKQEKYKIKKKIFTIFDEIFFKRIFLKKPRKIFIFLKHNI